MFLNFGIGYFVSYDHMISDLLTDCWPAGRGSVDTAIPFAIAARPWSGILHLMLEQWREAMHEGLPNPYPNLVSLAFDVISSAALVLVRRFVS